MDCMHFEKNVFESTIGILLDIKTKTKDEVTDGSYQLGCLDRNSLDTGDEERESRPSRWELHPDEK